MNLIDCQKNMPFDDSDDDGYFSHNEDRDDEFYSDYEDRDYEDRDYDEIFQNTEAEKITEDNEQYYKTRPKLQHPDEMDKILPSRILPSIEEQENEYAEWLEAEQLKVKKAQAVSIIKRFFSYCLSTKSTRAQLNYERYRHQQLREWKKLYDIPRTTRSIRRLDPIPPFNEEYLKYSSISAEHEKKKAIEQTAIEKVEADSLWSKWIFIQKKAGRAAGKKRFISNQGMNKNTAWHLARKANSLAVKETSTHTISAVGEGKRSQRKIKQEKKRKEAIEYQKRLDLYAPSSSAQLDETIIDIEISEEDKEAERALALSLVNKKCTTKIEDFLQAQKYQVDEKKKSEKKDRDSWTTIGTKKTKKVMSLDEFSNPIGLIKQSTKKRSADDANYSNRCNAFEVLGDKEKLGNALKFTRMCRSVLQGKKCYHPTCRFAHSVDQLTKRDCRFGMQCNFVENVGQGKYISRKFGRTGKTCSCYHPNETEQNFCVRLNLKYTPKPIIITPTTTVDKKNEFPIPITQTLTTNTTTTVDKKDALSKTVCVWSSLVTNTEAKVKYQKAIEKMTRSWASVVSSSAPASTPVTSKTITFTKPTFLWVQPAQPTQSTKPSHTDKVNEAVEKQLKQSDRNLFSLSKKRTREEEDKDWTLVQSKKQKKHKTKKNITVFRVGKENAYMAILSIIRSGFKDFKIELVDT